MAASKVAKSKTEFIREFPDLSPTELVEKAKAEGLSLSAGYVSAIRYREKGKGKASKRAPKTKASKTKAGRPSASAAYPRHTMEKCARLPKAILDQNAGRPCSREQLAGYLGVGLSGELATEISSANKYGFLETEGTLLKPTDLARKVLRPHPIPTRSPGTRRLF